MVHSLKLDLKNGYYEIVRGDDFNVISDDVNHLVYEEDGVWYVVSAPNERRMGNTTITIPQDINIKSFFLYGKNTAIKCDTVNARNVYIDLKDSAGEFFNIKCDRVGISMGKGEVRAKITEVESLKIDCGYGTANVDLLKGNYNVTSNCGMGEVSLNSKKLPREYENKTPGKNIDIVCGIGRVNINTYLR